MTNIIIAAVIFMILCVGELKMSFKDDYNDNKKKSHKVLKHNINVLINILYKIL